MTWPLLLATASTASRAAWWDSASAARDRTKANAQNPSRNYRAPLPLRRPTQQIKQAMPQMLGAGPMVPPQGLAQQQDICPLPHRKEMMPQ